MRERACTFAPIGRDGGTQSNQGSLNGRHNVRAVHEANLCASTILESKGNVLLVEPGQAVNQIGTDSILMLLNGVLPCYR